MTAGIQIAVDAAGPRTLAEFWCNVLGSVEQPPPPGYETWEEVLAAFRIDQSDAHRALAIVDPDGVGPRLFFQKVPEGNIPRARAA